MSQVIEISEEQLRTEIAQMCEIESQTSIADKIPVSKAYLNEIVNGKKPISEKVAQFFGYVRVEIPATRVFKRTRPDAEKLA
jgi:hypothetical protein